jgi:hypothetical protein
MNFIQTIAFLPNRYRSLFTQQSGMGSMPTSRVASGRFHKWFSHEVILKEYPDTIINFSNRDNRVIELGDILLPGWHCALLCQYLPGGLMKPHGDHPLFEPAVVLVNIGSAKLRVNREIRELKDGEIITFNSNYEHELYPVQNERWSLAFRRIKTEYLHLLPF